MTGDAASGVASTGLTDAGAIDAGHRRERVGPQAGARDGDQAERSGLRILARPAYGHREANPYTWLLYTHLTALGGVTVDEYSRDRLLSGRYDVLHLHWPEGHLNETSLPRALRRSITTIALLRLARRRGTKVIWTVHNLHAHERLHRRLERWFWRAFLGCVDGYINLSQTGWDAALARFPSLGRIPGAVVPHGHYRDAYGPVVSKRAARERLGIAPHAKVVAFVGQVRPYKNVPRLIDAFRGIADEDAVLLVAGEARVGGVASECRRAAGADERIRLLLDWIPGSEIQSYVAAADLVALPFGEVLNSGSALFALSFDRPVLVPALGSLQELAALVGPEWMSTYTGDLTADRLGRALSWAVEARRPPHAPLDALGWSGIAAATLRVFRDVPAPTRR